MGILTDLYRAKAAGIRTRRALAEAEADIIADFQRQHEHSTNIVDPSAYEWLNKLPDDPQQWTEDNFSEIQKRGELLYMTNQHIHGMVTTALYYVLGDGADIKSDDENPAVQAAWDALGLDSKHTEIVRRLFKHGEIFERSFVDSRTGDTKTALLDPWDIRDSRGKHSHGIETEPGDVTKPVRYYHEPEGGQREIIPAEQMFHYKIGVDETVKRGLPAFFIAFAPAVKYASWLENRMYLNELRTRIAVIMQYASPGALASAVGAATTTNSRGETKAQVPSRGTMFRAPRGTEVVMGPHNINAADVAPDGRNCLLTAAAGAGLPEWWVSGDASNNNYASSLTAEAPGNRAIQYWQGIVAEIFAERHSRAIKAKIAAGKLPEMSERTITTWDRQARQDVIETEKIPTLTTATVTLPAVETTGEKETTDAVTMQVSTGLVSKRTGRLRLGVDPESEKAQIEREESEDPDPMYPGADAARNGIDDGTGGNPDETE